MPLTRADKIQIDEYIQTGQIHKARRMLEDDDSPQAKKALEKLNLRYPPNATPSAAPDKPTPPPAAFAPTLTDLAPDVRKDEMEDVRQAIREKRYDDAEALLILSDHPDAEKLRGRLAQIRGKPMTAQKIKPPVNQASQTRRVILVALVVVLLGMCGLTYANLRRQSDEANRQLGMRYDIQDVCYEVFRDDYPDLSSDAFYDACRQEAESMIVSYRATVERCYDAWEDETIKEIECLADGGAKFDGIWLFSAAN